MRELAEEKTSWTCYKKDHLNRIREKLMFQVEEREREIQKKMTPELREEFNDLFSKYFRDAYAELKEEKHSAEETFVIIRDSVSHTFKHIEEILMSLKETTRKQYLFWNAMQRLTSQETHLEILSQKVLTKLGFKESAASSMTDFIRLLSRILFKLQITSHMSICLSYDGEEFNPERDERHEKCDHSSSRITLFLWPLLSLKENSKVLSKRIVWTGPFHEDVEGVWSHKTAKTFCITCQLNCTTGRIFVEGCDDSFGNFCTIFPSGVKVCEKKILIRAHVYIPPGEHYWSIGKMVEIKCEGGEIEVIGQQYFVHQPVKVLQPLKLLWSFVTCKDSHEFKIEFEVHPKKKQAKATVTEFHAVGNVAFD